MFVFFFTLTNAKAGFLAEEQSLARVSSETFGCSAFVTEQGGVKQGEEAEYDNAIDGNCLLEIVPRKTYIVLKIQRHEPGCSHCPHFAAHRHEEDE